MRREASVIDNALIPILTPGWPAGAQGRPLGRGMNEAALEMSPAFSTFYTSTTPRSILRTVTSTFPSPLSVFRQRLTAESYHRH